jgi:glycosyltransferase involved in cell wall biosynthesis
MEQAGDASLYFDPENPQELAETIYRLWNDAALRENLSLKGQKNSAKFSWDKTARIFRAHYRLLGGQSLKTEDLELVQDS